MFSVTRLRNLEADVLRLHLAFCFGGICNWKVVALPSCFTKSIFMIVQTLLFVVSEQWTEVSEEMWVCSLATREFEVTSWCVLVLGNKHWMSHHMRLGAAMRKSVEDRVLNTTLIKNK